MDASTRMFTLPDTQNMLTSLVRVSQEPQLIYGLYPLLLRYASTKKTGVGVVVMLQLAIRDYALSTGDRETATSLAAALKLRMDEFVTALIVDDTIRQATLAKLQQMRQE